MTINNTLTGNFVAKIIQFVTTLILLLPVAALANSQRDVTTVANNIISAFWSVETLLVSIAYIVGIAFALSAIIKFKNHKENPQQVPLSNPVIELCVALALIFLPTMIEIFEATMLNEAIAEPIQPIRGGNVNVNNSDTNFAASNGNGNNNMAIQIPNNCLQYQGENGELLLYCMAEDGNLVPIPAEMFINNNNFAAQDNATTMDLSISTQNGVDPDIVRQLQERLRGDDVALSMLRALQSQE